MCFLFLQSRFLQSTTHLSDTLARADAAGVCATQYPDTVPVRDVAEHPLDASTV
jgi:hypothetical protein